MGLRIRASAIVRSFGIGVMRAALGDRAAQITAEGT
jgi:hypothetical protein